MTVAGVSAARAVEAVNVRTDAAAIDLTDAVDLQHTEGDRIQVSTAPGADAIVRRIEVRAREAGKNWAVFALANNGDEQIDRLIVAPHYRMVGSGLIWPDLGRSRIVYITPSSGDPPERQDSADADVFRVTLDPGTVITFVAELRTPNIPQLYLWEPDAYKDKVNSLTLYQGIVIGIAGLLALFLTILFVVKGSVMFPAAAALGWAVLVYIGIDFGFWNKVFDMSAGAERIWRASGEAILAATLVGVPVRLSQPQPLARALRPHHRRLARLPRRAGRHRAVLARYRLGHRAHLAVSGRRVRLHSRGLSLHPRLRPRGDADPDLALAGRLGGRRRADRPGLRHQRYRRPGAARRPRPHRHADRLYRDAARLRRRHHPRHRLRRRTPRAGAHRRRRHDLGLGRRRRQGFHQPRDRNRARPQSRHAGRLGGEVARRAASARSRPLPRHARQCARTAARPGHPGFPPAHGRRPLSVVRAAGAAGGRLRRRSDPAGRHADRRHRIQNRRGAPAARRRARQSHRPAEPRIVPRPARRRARLRQDRQRA